MTGISQAMVEGQPRFADQLPAMMRFLEGAAVMGHNIRFDLSFLHAEFRRAGMEMKTALGDVPAVTALLDRAVAAWDYYYNRLKPDAPDAYVASEALGAMSAVLAM